MARPTRRCYGTTVPAPGSAGRRERVVRPVSPRRSAGAPRAGRPPAGGPGGTPHGGRGGAPHGCCCACRAGPARAAVARRAPRRGTPTPACREGAPARSPRPAPPRCASPSPRGRPATARRPGRGTAGRRAPGRRARARGRGPRPIRPAAVAWRRPGHPAPAPARGPRRCRPGSRRAACPAGDASESISATEPKVIQISTTAISPRTKACRNLAGPPSSRTTRRPSAILPSVRPRVAVSKATG